MANPGNGFLIFIASCAALWMIGQRFNFGAAWNAGLGRAQSALGIPTPQSQAPGTTQTFPFTQLSAPSYQPPAIPYMGVSVA